MSNMVENVVRFDTLVFSKIYISIAVYVKGNNCCIWNCNFNIGIL
jgi:hypothetical protein